METSTRKMRITGGILLAAGLVLSGGMGWLIFWLQNVIANPGASGRWNGGPEFTAATFQLFYSILFFGVASLGAGLFQTVTGRRNKLVLTPFLLACLWLGYALWALLSLDKTL